MPTADRLRSAAIALLAAAALSANAEDQAVSALPASTPTIGLPFPVTPADYLTYAGAPAATLTNIELEPGLSVTLNLTAVDAFTPDARIVNVTTQGEIDLPRPDVALFNGHIAGDDDSIVMLSVAPAGVQGFVRRSSITYIISSGPYTNPGPTIVFNLNTLPPDAITWSPFECGADSLPTPPGTTGKGGASGSPGTGPRSSPCRVASVAFDTDNELLATFSNNPSYAGIYVATLVAGINAIYKQDINTRIVSSYVRFWTAPDPWSAGNTGDELGEFQNYWNANMGNVPRNAAHFLSTRPLGGGVAYIPALCNTPWAYAVSANLAGHFPYPLVDHNAQNWDIMVTAHELGHNFNAPHTHSTTPPIDNCGNGDCSQAWGGTIMSYCHTCPGGMTNIVLDLHPTIESDYILPFLSSGVSCNLNDLPIIYAQPESQVVCAYQPVTFTIAAASANGTLQYQWRKNGVNLANGNDFSYTITAPTSASAGAYNVLLTDDCGASYSDAASLTIQLPGYCPKPGDVNGDGVVDLSDLAELIASFGACDSQPNFDGAANIIQDSCIDLSDLAVLLSNFGH